MSHPQPHLIGTPAGYDDLRARIAGTSDTMPKRLAQAADYALAHPEDIALGTAASIAKAAQVQPSTFVRLAHHLGYEGFSDLQSVFRDRLKSRSSTYEERLRQLETGLGADTYEGALLGGFLKAARQSIDRLADSVNPADFGKSVGILAQADIIYLVARRRAYPLVAHMSYGFGKLGIRHITVSTANDIDEELIASASPKDAAIVCSFSPYAPESVRLAGALAQRKLPIVAITDSAMSPLCTMSRVWLEVSESDYAGFRSISGSMAIAAALPVAVAERRRHRK